MNKRLTYTTMASTLIGGLLLWRGIHDVWFLNDTRADWDGQVIPQAWKEPLLWVHLGTQIGIGAGLWAGVVRNVIRSYALGGAVLLFAVYTIYSELALLERLPRKPCACIGWWEGSTWGWMAVANGMLLLTMLFVFILERFGQERRVAMA